MKDTNFTLSERPRTSVPTPGYSTGGLKLNTVIHTVPVLYPGPHIDVRLIPHPEIQ